MLCLIHSIDDIKSILRTNGPEHSIFSTDSQTFIWIPYTLAWDTKLQHHYPKVPATRHCIIVFIESNQYMFIINHILTDRSSFCPITLHFNDLLGWEFEHNITDVCHCNVSFHTSSCTGKTAFCHTQVNATSSKLHWKDRRSMPQVAVSQLR